MAPPPSLDKRPQATTYRVEDLLDLVREGRIRVPPFQRPWRWDAEDVASLFDSLYRGYPVGTLLLWKRKGHAETLTLGPHTFPVPERDDALSVVDGQQRITALAGVLLQGHRTEGGAIFDLYFDLSEQKFVRPVRGRAAAADWLPMHVLVDEEDLFTWLDEYRKHEPPRDRVQLAFRLGKLVREYEIPAYLVDSEAEEVLRHIFHRVNRSGKPLKEADVFDALHGVPGRAEPGELQEVAERLKTTEFGVFDTDILLRTLTALLGRDVATDDGQTLPSNIEPGEALARTERALRRMIAFLREDARIPHLRLLPYTMTVIALAVFFDRHPAPMPRNRGLLARWIWRGAMTGAHRGDTRSLRSTLASIEEKDESAAVQALLEALPKKPKKIAKLDSFNFRHARSKLEGLAMLDLAPKHLRTGRPISVLDVLEDEGRRDVLPVIVHAREDASGELGELVTTVANRLVHPTLEHKTRRRALFEGVPDDVLASHAIPPSAARKLASGDVLGFLKERRRLVESHIDAFLERRAGWSQSDRPPLKSLLVEDD